MDSLVMPAGISDSFQEAGDTLFATLAEWIPRLLGALLVLIIGYIVAKVVSNLVGRVLGRLDLERWVAKTPAKDLVDKMGSWTLAKIAALAVFWLIWLAVIGMALGVLDIEAVNDGVAAVWSYLPHIIAALVILVIGVFAAGYIRDLLSNVTAGTAYGAIVTALAPVVILVLAGFMALDQLQIAENIVTTAFTLVLGAIALGAAIAFGLGGKEHAARLLDAASDKAK